MRSQPSSIATRNGVIAGVILGILSLPVITLSAVGRVAGAGGGLGLLFLLVALIVFAVAGYSASRYNGLLRSGVWAGFLAALITTFIAICLGVVIVTLLTPYALLATPALRRPGAHPGARLALAGRLAFIRLALGAVGLLLGGLLAGLIGGLLGRIGRPRRGASEPSAPTFGGDLTTPTQVYATPTPPTQGYQSYPGAEMGYTPASASATPSPYPTATAYDDSAPTTVRDSLG